MVIGYQNADLVFAYFEAEYAVDCNEVYNVRGECDIGNKGGFFIRKDCLRILVARYLEFRFPFLVEVPEPDLLPACCNQLCIFVKQDQARITRCLKGA